MKKQRQHKSVPLRKVRAAIKLIKKELYTCQYNNFLRGNTILCGIQDLQDASSSYLNFRKIMIELKYKTLKKS